MSPPDELGKAGIADAWQWAIAHWNKNAVPKHLNLRLKA
jgi:hypothetical protein